MGVISSRNDEIDRLRSRLGLGGVAGTPPASLGLPQQQQRSVTQMTANLGSRGMGSARFEGQGAPVYSRDNPQGDQTFGLSNQSQRLPSQSAMEQGEAPERSQMMRPTVPYGGAMGGNMQPTVPPAGGGPTSLTPPLGSTSSALNSPMSMQPQLPPSMNKQMGNQFGGVGQMNQLGGAGQMNQLGGVGQMGNQFGGVGQMGNQFGGAGQMGNQFGGAGQMNQAVQSNLMGPGPIRQASEDRTVYSGSGVPRNGSYEVRKADLFDYMYSYTTKKLNIVTGCKHRTVLVRF